METLRLNVSQALGRIPTQLLYVLIVSSLTVGFILGVYQLYRMLDRVNGKKTVAEPVRS